MNKKVLYDCCAVSAEAFPFAVKVGVCIWSHVEAFRHAKFKDRATDAAAS